MQTHKKHHKTTLTYTHALQTAAAQDRNDRLQDLVTCTQRSLEIKTSIRRFHEYLQAYKPQGSQAGARNVVFLGNVSLLICVL
jgi:hypothetical protein